MTATVVSRADGGFGLGLAIAKHLIQARGGEIGVESPSPEFILSKVEGLKTGEGGEGTTFYFTLLLSCDRSKFGEVY